MIAAPLDPELTERLGWLQEVHGPYDPDEFDPAAVTARLSNFDPLARGHRRSLTVRSR